MINNKKKITLMGNVKIIENDNKKYVLKPKTPEVKNVFEYLKSRNFDYYPSFYDDKKYDIYDYIEDSHEPDEQKIDDLISLISLLHYKTTYYKQVDIDDFKYRYEELKDRLNFTLNYYNDALNSINNEVYMSPSSYFLARNISLIFQSINYSFEQLEIWYDKVKNKNKVRYVTNHNNASLEHFIKNDRPYLISWDRNKTDMPILDLIVLYKKHYLNFDFYYLFKKYEEKYPLLEEEKILLFVYIMIPDIVTKNENEYETCKKYFTLTNYIDKSFELATKYSIKNQTN